jgi:phage-related protein (TIGR01555 family)
MAFWNRKKAPEAQVEQRDAKPATRSGFFSTHSEIRTPNFARWIQANAFQKTAADFMAKGANGEMVAMDDSSNGNFKSAFNVGQAGVIPQNLFAWYVSQSFIGFQACGVIAQHWLVDKACSQAPSDAVRKGYDITLNGGVDVDVETIDKIKVIDRDYKINQQLVQFAKFNRVFGIRIAIFHVESNDPLYYEKPFNIDGVGVGKYKGFSQVDPYWITPELDQDASANPASKFFYEPTWWRVNGKRYHRTHLVVIRYSEVTDIMKPSYLFGGLPLPQLIMERVYGAERTANEAPLLAMTKRTTVLHTDMNQVMADQGTFEEKLATWIHYRDNYAVKVLGEEETMEQIDTGLADLDAIIMTQYQIVAAIAKTPATKLLGTSVKGFSATGEFDESAYHEYLETIQTDELDPLLKRHYELMMKSDFPELYEQNVSIEVAWPPLDSMTEMEMADIQLKTSQTVQALQATGAVDGLDIRQRLIEDKFSGFNGLQMPEEFQPEPDPLDDDATATDPDAEGGVEVQAGEEELGAEGGLETVDEPVVPVVNQVMTNMTGKNFQHLERILNKVRKGSISEAQGVMMLQGAFGMTAEQASEFMGIVPEED